MSGIADSALLSQESGSGLNATHEATVSPVRRKSRVSFAGIDEKDRSGDEKSPEKRVGCASENLPPSPCRGRRSTQSLGLRLSLGSTDALADGDDAFPVRAVLPSSPPDSPGRMRQFWRVMKQREEELESKQRQLEEFEKDAFELKEALEQQAFELKEEKREQRRSRRFLAKKMSELEARELRAAKQEERRFSASTSESSALERTPCPSSIDSSPQGFLKFEELLDCARQSEDITTAAAADPPEQETLRPRTTSLWGLCCLAVDSNLCFSRRSSRLPRRKRASGSTCCQVCGKHVGYIAGIRGFGFRQRRHVARCVAKASAEMLEDDAGSILNDGEYLVAGNEDGYQVAKQCI